MKSNLPSTENIEWVFWEKYNMLVIELERMLGADFGWYKLLETDFERIITSVEQESTGIFDTNMKQKVNYSKEPYVSKYTLLQKIDALLIRFTIDQQNIKIWFKTD